MINIRLRVLNNFIKNRLITKSDSKSINYIRQQIRFRLWARFQTMATSRPFWQGGRFDCTPLLLLLLLLLVWRVLLCRRRHGGRPVIVARPCCDAVVRRFLGHCAAAAPRHATIISASSEIGVGRSAAERPSSRCVPRGAVASWFSRQRR